MNPRPPSKTKLKKKYGITNNDFKVLTALPPEPEKNGATLERAADWAGVPTWLWRNKTASVLAIIIALPAAIPEVRTKAITGIEFYAEQFRPFQKLPTPVSPARGLIDLGHVAVSANTSASSMTVIIGLPPA